jgi:hypothetical protein
MVKKKQDNPLAGLPRFNVDPGHTPMINRILQIEHLIDAKSMQDYQKELEEDLVSNKKKNEKNTLIPKSQLPYNIENQKRLVNKYKNRAKWLEEGRVTPFQWTEYTAKDNPIPGDDRYWSHGLESPLYSTIGGKLQHHSTFNRRALQDRGIDWVGNDVPEVYVTKNGKLVKSGLPKTSEKPVASKKKTKSGKGWMEIVSGPGAGTYKMPEEEKEARAAAKAGREALKAEGKGKRGKSGYETNNAEEITKINEERKKASKEAGVWRESSYPNPIGVKSPKETPAVSAPTTEKSTTVATSKPTKKTKAQPPTPAPSAAEQQGKDKAAKSKRPDPIAQISAEEPKPKGKPKAQPKEAPASRVTEETAKQDETPAAPSNPMVLDDGGMPKGGPKYILNTDKSGSGTPEYGDINRARDVAAGKEQGFAAGSSKSAPAESSDGKRNKYIIGGGKSGVPARYGTMNEARAFAEQERTRQDRIGNGRVRAFGESSGVPTGGKATFYDFSDDDLGVSKPAEASAGKKPGLIERIKGKVRGGKKDGVTSPSGATSTPPAPPTPPGTAGAGAPPPPPPGGGGKGGFAPPSAPPSAGSRGGSFDAGHTAAGHSGAVKFAPQTQQTAQGGSIVMGNQGSQNQIYAPGASGGFSNIGNNSGGAPASSNPVVASTGGNARSTSRNATVLSTGGDAVQSHPRAANASSSGRPTTKRK